MKPVVKYNSKCVTHVSHGDVDAVAAHLRVLIKPAKNGGFCAQGIDIDYVAVGETEEQARDRFQTGFIKTIESCLRRKRNVESLFKSDVPALVKRDFLFGAEEKPLFTCAIVGKFEGIPDMDRYSAIDYFSVEEQATV